MYSIYNTYIIGHLNVVKYLLESGCGALIDDVGSSKCTPLHRACMEGNLMFGSHMYVGNVLTSFISTFYILNY